jgi:hypothetical protein
MQKLCIYDSIGYGGKTPPRRGLVMITLVTRGYDMFYTITTITIRDGSIQAFGMRLG